MDPSPYLRGLPALPPDLLRRIDQERPLTRRERRLLQKHLAKCRRRLRAAREAWEAAHGPVDIEPPAGLAGLL